MNHGSVNAMFTLEQATKARGGRRGTVVLFFLTSAVDGGGWNSPVPTVTTEWQLRKQLRVNQKEEEKMEDLDSDGWKMLKRTYER